MPARAQRHDGVVEVNADFTAHGHHHGLSLQGRQAVLEVLDDVRRHLLDARRGADQYFQRRPTAHLGDAGRVVLLVFGEFLHFVVQVWRFLIPEFQFGEAALVINGHCCAILDGLFHVVDMHVIAEHGAGVAVFQRYGRAGEGHEGGIRQRIAQVPGIAVANSGCRRRGIAIGDVRGRVVAGEQLGRAAVWAGEFSAELAGGALGGLRPASQPRRKAILAAVGLVADDDDVRTLGKYRENVLVFAGGELLDGSEDDAAGRAVGEQLAQPGPGIGLHRCFPQQLRRAGKDAEELVVQVVAVGHHHQRRVAHPGVLHQHATQAGHLYALARALGMPDHAALARAARRRRLKHTFHHSAHGMELVVASHFLDQSAVVFEQDEMAQVVEQQFALEQAMHQRLQFLHRPERVGAHAVDGAPGHEALRRCGERAHARLDAIGNDQHSIGNEQVGDVFLVGLELVEGSPDIGVLVAGVLQLQHRQRQPVDEQHQVGPAVELGALHAKLVDRQPFISGHVAKVNESDPVTAPLAILLELDRHTFHQPTVHLAIGLHLPEDVRIEHLARCFVLSAGRNVRVQAADGRAQAVGQDDLAVGVALAARGVGIGWRNIGTMSGVPAQASQPLQRRLFDMVFQQE